MTSKVPEALRNRLLQVATALALGAATVALVPGEPPPSDAVRLAMEIGAFYESSNRHIGTPYIDKAGKGQPWTVCAGITGAGVVPGKTYTREDCKRLELPRYRRAEAQAAQALRHWRSYNVWVRASFIDMAFNVPSALEPDTTIMRRANAGDLAGACLQMPRWVYGTVNGRSARLPGLVGRRATTAELCAEWGRDGHFSSVEVMA